MAYAVDGEMAKPDASSSRREISKVGRDVAQESGDGAARAVDRRGRSECRNRSGYIK